MPATLDIDRIVRETWIASAEHHEEIDSTNDRAKRSVVEFFHAPPAERPSLPHLITADRQTTGRGRGSNRWWTGDGALALSVLLDLQDRKIPIRSAPLLGIATGVALVKTTRESLASEVNIGLHWPNDIYIGDAKAAGILIELVASRFAVIGIGINLNNTIADAPASVQERKIATLKDLLGRPIDPTEFLISLLQTLDVRLQEIVQDTDSLIRSANDFCSQRNKELRVEDGERTCRGRCLGLAEDGALILETDAGEERFYAGTTEVL